MKLKLITRSIGIGLMVASSSYIFADTPRNWSQQLQLRLAESPQWQQLGSQVIAAEAELTAAQQPVYNPEIEFSYEDKNERAYQATLSQTIDLFDKRDTRSQIAALQKQITKLEQQQSENQITASALTLLLETRRAKALLSLADDQLKISQRLIKLTQQRLYAGDATQIDLDIVKLSSSEALQTKAAAQQALQNYQAEQTVLLGDLIPTLPQPLPYTLSQTPDFIRLSQQHLAVKTLGVRAQQAQLRVQESVNESKAEPTLGLGFGQDGDDDVIALSISFPLNIRNSYSAEVDAANARAKTSDLALAQVRVEIETALQRSWSSLKQQQSLQQIWQKPGQHSLVQLNSQLEKLWKLGELTTTNYLQNLQQLNQALAADINLNTESDIRLIDWLHTSNQLQDWLDQQ
ncbi:TolC family protein [uncultured Neptuniibacter sp.]|uniref:TolC family protein n=1 Tax=uncultured Neptuniibacter sp. TaxID=502143 RepID=UPI002628994F|nr:TolC family protein [uncultured Neptuniibacter sp.]